uniref:3-hydroxybutyrate dehydrogenase n=1 Tax=Acidiphilium TaxID=522 RepID=UPI000494AC1C|nr:MULTISPECIES: 3-hydroxybutyrate dehydrogenase [Acidiphilium]
MGLAGKIALVTGSTSGIGLGIARELARAGATIVLNGFGDPTAIEATRSAIAGEFGVTVAFEAADLTKPAEIDMLARRCKAAFGSIDILVNNAGIQHVASIEDFPVEKWDAVIALNLSAVFHGMKAVLPGMKRRGWGRIINIASAHGLVASAHKIAYVAAKHGVVGATKVAAIECANDGITVNAICPGWVLTPLVQAQIEARAAANGTSVSAESNALLAEKQPMLAFTTPEKIGQFAAFLCSEAGSTMTGAALSIDGGWVAQ